MKHYAIIALLGAAALPAAITAQMPVVQTAYTADPAPMVHNDTVFLYTTHDEDNADGFLMKDWLLYTSTDMVNWTDCGPVASLKNFQWYDGDNGAWAEQVVERDGKFYMYCPIHGHGIGVLVADSPYGPFTDPIGKPLVWQREHWYDIDPTVFVDNDGQAYMYWGNPNLYCVRLNPDMISYSGDIMQLETPEHYQEGPWFYRRNDKYYLAFASTCCPEGIGYAMSDSPTGPWTTQGYIMRPTDRTRGNHPGIIDYKGRTYVFGLNYDLLRMQTLTHHERRSVSGAEMHYNPDGTIAEVPYWKENRLEQTEPFNPYRRVQAETMAWGFGLKTRPHGQRNMIVTDVDPGEFICIRGVRFNGKDGQRFTASVASARGDASIELRLNAPDGVLIGTLSVPATGSADTFRDISCDINGAVGGMHDLYLVFRGTGRDILALDHWQFSAE